MKFAGTLVKVKNYKILRATKSKSDSQQNKDRPQSRRNVTERPATKWKIDAKINSSRVRTEEAQAKAGMEMLKR